MDIFGARGQGIPIMAWFSNLGPHDQGNAQEQLGLNFKRLVQVRKGERENAKETMEKRKENSTLKIRKMRQPKQEEEEKKELSTQGP